MLALPGFDFCASSAPPSRYFISERCSFEPVGARAPINSFYSCQPELGSYIKNYDMDYLLSDECPYFEKIDVAIRNLPEYEAFCSFVKEEGFFFASFPQTGKKRDSCGQEICYTSEDDVKNFLLARLKHSSQVSSPLFQFVIRTHEDDVIGYASLFKQQFVGWDLQYERSVFIGPAYQGQGYGKESMIALTKFAFEELKVDRIYTKVAPDNIKSRNNIERHFGAIFMGEQDFEATSNPIPARRRTYVILPEEFYAARLEEVYRASIHSESRTARPVLT